MTRTNKFSIGPEAKGIETQKEAADHIEQLGSALALKQKGLRPVLVVSLGAVTPFSIGPEAKGIETAAKPLDTQHDHSSALALKQKGLRPP